jgi:type II secretory ATPase GspE/PulE/Tfp pilus assembly ATPase PilB-like protein
MMYMNENMRAAVSTEKNLEVLRDIAKKNGMVTLWESCKGLVEKGTTSISELMTLNAE